MTSVRYFYGAGHEQFRPSVLRDHAQLAEAAGFDGIACSDHFQPWWEGGESGQAWVWLGAAAQATSKCVIGPAVTPSLKRYHPALVAQAFSTFEELFPGRTFLAVGSGESLNETPFGCDWPDREGQFAALAEALSVIRRLWAGESLDERGRFFETRGAKLHTRAGKPPPLFVSAFHPEAARLAAIYGDGLWTLADPASAPALIEAFRAQRAEDGREPGEVILQALISWDVDDQAALEAARPWKGAQPSEYYVDDWHDPQAMYEHAEATITDDEFMKGAIISADASEHIRRLREIEEMGATIVAVMNCSGHDPEGAIRLYHETVLPALRTQT